MGKGGEKPVTKGSKATSRSGDAKLKLEHMSTEELKKWAKAYGVNSESERELLLAALVSSWGFLIKTTGKLLMIFIIIRILWRMGSWILIDLPIYLWSHLNLH